MTSYPNSMHPNNFQNSINYELILFNLQKQSETAFKAFSESKNLVTYATDLSEIILNALDEGLCYPHFDIYEFLRECWTIAESKQSDTSQ